MALDWLDAGLVLAGGPLGAAAVANKEAAEAQGDAATEAAALTQQQAEDAQRLAGFASTVAGNQLDRALPGIEDSLTNAYMAGSDALAQGFGTARSDLLQGSQYSADALGYGQDSALASLYGGADQGIGYLANAQGGIDSAINSGLAGAGGLLGNRQDRGGAMLDAGLYGGFEADPGYAYRLAESEKAINRSAAARGGRLGGATLKALQENAQGLASQEFGNFANRRLQEFGAASSNDAAQFAADSQLANLYYGAGSQLAGAQQALGGQAASMAYGAGQGGADIYGNTGSMLAQLYGNTGSQLAGNAVGAGSALGSAASQYYSGLADLDWNAVMQQNGYVLGAAGVMQGQLPTLAAANSAGVPYAGAGWAAAGAALNSGMNLAATYYGAKGS